MLNSITDHSISQILIDEIKISSKDLNNLEKKKNYLEASQIVEKIISLLKMCIDKNKSEMSKDNINSLYILQKSYEAKLNSYEYFSFINEKTFLIKNKMTEKYLCKKIKTDNNSDSNNPSKISEFEIIPETTPSDILKEITEVCSSLIKYYNINVNKNKNQSLKKVNNYESFFVYDFQKTVGKSQNFMDKYIEEVKLIKIDCDKLSGISVNYEDGSVKELEKKIVIIRDEINKIYPKFKNLKQILEKKELVGKTNNKK